MSRRSLRIALQRSQPRSGALKLSSLSPPHSYLMILFESEELLRASGDDPISFSSGYALEIVRDHFVGMRECSLRMRVVRRPHDVLAAGMMTQFHADRITDERSVNVLIEVVAGWMRDMALRPVTLHLPGAIHIRCRPGNPTHTRLYQTDAEQ